MWLYVSKSMYGGPEREDCWQKGREIGQEAMSSNGRKSWHFVIRGAYV